jgi:hypothetical protein
MKVVKTSELSGNALNHVVARLEGHEWRCPWMLAQDGYEAWQGYEHGWGNPTPEYSTDWAQGGPIIEREGIAPWPVSARLTGWVAESHTAFVLGRGATPLEAAMRCYVASKLGDEVEIPDELA